MVYKWKTGYNKVSAETAGKVFEELEKTIGLTAKNLVDASRAEDSPLHGEFEWNDTIAGEKWRCFEAGNMIRNLVVQVDDIPDAPLVRAYVMVEPSTPQYESIITVVQDSDKTAKLLHIAIEELKQFERKYKDLQQFAALFAEIDKLIAAA